MELVNEEWEGGGMVVEKGVEMVGGDIKIRGGLVVGEEGRGGG